MKKFAILALLGAALVAAPAQAAEMESGLEGSWMVRVRALGVLPDESSSTSIGGRVKADNDYVPELDFSYFFTNNIAAELILATSKHEVRANGTTSGDVDVGHAWALPPTLTAQYHFTQFDGIKPYLGAGVNYTMFYNEKPGALSSVSYDDSFGPALQAGVDIPLNDRWYFNADVKKVWMNTTAKFNGGAITADVDLDPWLVGVGFGYRF